MKSADEVVVVLCTVGRREDAEGIAAAIVERGLAACANILPGIVSVYRWRGELQKDEEWLLVVKTLRERFEDLRAAIVALHPYEVPEVVALPVVAGHPPYLSWVAANSSRS